MDLGQFWRELLPYNDRMAIADQFLPMKTTLTLLMLLPQSPSQHSSEWGPQHTLGAANLVPCYQVGLLCLPVLLRFQGVLVIWGVGSSGGCWLVVAPFLLFVFLLSAIIVGPNINQWPTIR